MIIVILLLFFELGSKLFYLRMSQESYSKLMVRVRLPQLVRLCLMTHQSYESVLCISPKYKIDVAC